MKKKKNKEENKIETPVKKEESKTESTNQDYKSMSNEDFMKNAKKVKLNNVDKNQLNFYLKDINDSLITIKTAKTNEQRAKAEKSLASSRDKATKLIQNNTNVPKENKPENKPIVPKQEVQKSTEEQLADINRKMKGIEAKYKNNPLDLDMDNEYYELGRQKRKLEKTKK